MVLAKGRSTPVLVAACLALRAMPVAAGDAFTTVGDVSLVLVPVAAGIYTYRHADPQGTPHDENGMVQFTLNTVATFGATRALKSATDKRRPDFEPGDARDSFPSGHVTAAWSGAAYLRARYGFEEAWPVMVPAYALAIATAASRVENKKHHIEDVIAGAVLSELMAQAFVGRWEDDGLVPIFTIREDGFDVMFQFRF